MKQKNHVSFFFIETTVKLDLFHVFFSYLSVLIEFKTFFNVRDTMKTLSAALNVFCTSSHYEMRFVGLKHITFQASMEGILPLRYEISFKDDVQNN